MKIKVQHDDYIYDAEVKKLNIQDLVYFGSESLSSKIKWSTTKIKFIVLHKNKELEVSIDQQLMILMYSQIRNKYYISSYVMNFWTFCSKHREAL